MRTLAVRPVHVPPARTHAIGPRAALAFCRDAGLPAPQTNIWIGEQEVDAFWPERHVVVELDSYEYRAAFERDRARDARLQIAGYSVLRVTHRRLHEEPAAVDHALRSLLRRG